MTVPSSNISMTAINNEVTSVNSTNLRVLSENAVPAKTAPHAMGEFAGYTHITWPTTIVYAPDNYFTSVQVNQYGNTAVAGTVVRVTWNSNNTHTVQFGDFTGSLNVYTQSYSSAQTFYTNATPSTLEVRWIFYQYDRIISSAADSNDDLDINYHSANSQVFNGTDSSVANQTYYGPWQFCTPQAWGGSNANTQTSYVRATATGGGDAAQSQQDSININTDNSAQYVGLQYRANQNDVITFRNSLNTNVSLVAQSYTININFTCIMPDMLVLRKVIIDDLVHDEWIRIGDIEVGDHILAQGDLNDSNVSPQWAEVTEARTHNREGYWDVGGIHITNDHPVWLTDDTHSAWVKVEDMRDDIERTYVEGSVDPVYLGTTPGHYYVWDKDKNKVFTVSGDYAPQTG